MGQRIRISRRPKPRLAHMTRELVRLLNAIEELEELRERVRLAEASRVLHEPLSSMASTRDIWRPLMPNIHGEAAAAVDVATRAAINKASRCWVAKRSQSPRNVSAKR
jgi:hypothetical protein